MPEVEDNAIVVFKGKTERWYITQWLDTKDGVPRVSCGLQYLNNKELPPVYKFKPGGFALTRTEAYELADAIKVMADLLPEEIEEEGE